MLWDYFHSSSPSISSVILESTMHDAVDFIRPAWFVSPCFLSTPIAFSFCARANLTPLQAFLCCFLSICFRLVSFTFIYLAWFIQASLTRPKVFELASLSV